MDIDQLRYPIGKYQPPQPITEAHIRQWIDEIAAFPSNFRKTVVGMTESQLATPYREGGWTVRQTVNHVADSHMNSYMRFKLALTEENPTIKPYIENLWAELDDGRNASVESSLTLISLLHERWLIVIRSMKPSDFQRTFFHPQRKTTSTLASTLGLYAWHGKHHLAHIQNLKERMKW
jgi:uncharacterized damage-inducible protein DinB